MAAMAKFGRLVKPLISNNGIISATRVRFASAWHMDNTPNPYPRTPEERAAAAKRYGLRPEDYEPMPKDGYGHGDYPELPLIPSDERDDFTNWDDKVNKRNYGEPVPLEWDMITGNRVNTHETMDDPKRYRAYRWAVLGACVIVYNLYGFNRFNDYIPPYGPKQYLEEGVVHYSFEPVES